MTPLRSAIQSSLIATISGEATTSGGTRNWPGSTRRATHCPGSYLRCVQRHSGISVPSRPCQEANSLPLGKPADRCQVFLHSFNVLFDIGSSQRGVRSAHWVSSLIRKYIGCCARASIQSSIVSSSGAQPKRRIFVLIRVGVFCCAGVYLFFPVEPVLFSVDNGFVEEGHYVFKRRACNNAIA